jgi:hypothetical protein
VDGVDVHEVCVHNRAHAILKIFEGWWGWWVLVSVFVYDMKRVIPLV